MYIMYVIMKPSVLTDIYNNKYTFNLYTHFCFMCFKC